MPPSSVPKEATFSSASNPILQDPRQELNLGKPPHQGLESLSKTDNLGDRLFQITNNYQKLRSQIQSSPNQKLIRHLLSIAKNLAVLNAKIEISSELNRSDVLAKIQSNAQRLRNSSAKIIDLIKKSMSSHLLETMAADFDRVVRWLREKKEKKNRNEVLYFAKRFPDLAKAIKNGAV